LHSFHNFYIARRRIGYVQRKTVSAGIHGRTVAATARDIDRLIRPVLMKQFGDARLVSAKGPEAAIRDGEVIEDRLLYVVKTFLTEAQGEALHDAFSAAHFVVLQEGKEP
jgi:hypothetical protein